MCNRFLKANRKEGSKDLFRINLEAIMIEKIYLNNDWSFTTSNQPESKIVRIPHTSMETPFHYFDEKEYQFISFYKKEVNIPIEWLGLHLFLTFEGVAHIAKLYVNNQFVGEHKGGYHAFSFDIAPFVQFGMINNICVEVDNREINNIPPFGNVIDYLCYGGIYRDVYLEIKENTYIADVFVKTKFVDDKQVLLYDVTVNGLIENIEVDSFIKEKNKGTWESLGTNLICEQTSTFCHAFQDKRIWDMDNPNLYELKIIIKKQEEIDHTIITFGFRTCEFRRDGFYLNNQLVKLRGLNRHQSYPYVGYAMPKRVQQLDATILKEELGLHAVRTSHYSQSQYFIERCDEIGLLVFTEIPGWQYIGNQEWKDVALEMTKEMVLQYRNHPSIILWGARINESQDDDEFYSATNKIIHDLDETRQTGGVRFTKNSHLLEDVYTYNDFSHTGNNAGLEAKQKVTNKKNAPYLVSEYNGHMFPTKAFDKESHRLDHALRHANVLQSFYNSQEIAAAFGWCMFDYNTHKDFGSGDRICYHGVMTMFRNPKLAASVYASQSDNQDVLEISSSMDIGEYPGGNIKKVYAFSNADYVKVYKNNEFVRSFYPSSQDYGKMPHPPILIDDFIGQLIEVNEGYRPKNAKVIKEVLLAIVKYGQYNLPLSYQLKMAKVMLLEKIKISDGVALYSKYVGNWGDESTTYRFEAIKQEKVVKIVEKSATTKIKLSVSCDTLELKEDTSYDVATIRIQIINQLNQVVPYYQGVLHLDTTGCIEIIGPKSISAIGGSTGTYIKTIGQSGKGTFIISGDGLEEVVIHYIVL